jgi:mannitol/fructose-specific phosphotransferase system IIA component (Ntr-type)
MIAAKGNLASLAAYLHADDIHLALTGATQLDVLRQLTSCFELDPESRSTMLKALLRRESIGATALGHGVAVPHCRTSSLPGLRVAFGRHPAGVAWGAPDAEPVHFIFLLAAPHVSSEYLPVLGKVAHFLNSPENRRRLGEITSTDEFFRLIADTGL